MVFLFYNYCSKPIPGTSNWFIVFTKLGKYFFHNPSLKQRSWIPPDSVLKVLNEKMSPLGKEMFFDPFCEEEILIFSSSEAENDQDSESKDGIQESESESETQTECKISLNNISYSKSKSEPTVSKEQVEQEYKELLVNESIDPFAQWSSITEKLSSFPQFNAVSSEKRRQEIFEQVCPLLIVKKREEKSKLLCEAKTWWNDLNKSAGKSWLEFSKNIKSDKRFALLDQKECEKQYKAQLKNK